MRRFRGHKGTGVWRYFSSKTKTLEISYTWINLQCAHHIIRVLSELTDKHRFTSLLSALVLWQAFTNCPSLTQWSNQSQTSQGIKRTEHGPEGFDPHWDGTISLYCVRASWKTPGFHQDYVSYSVDQRQKTTHCTYFICVVISDSTDPQMWLDMIERNSKWYLVCTYIVCPLQCCFHFPIYTHTMPCKVPDQLGAAWCVFFFISLHFFPYLTLL